MRGKIKRFEDNENRENILQSGKDGYENIKGKWHTNYFENSNNIVLELACGRGEYTIGMARLFSDKNFIGVDLKGDRLWEGSGIATDEKFNHVVFLRAEILHLEDFIAPNEVNEIWITFPDPRPKGRDEKRRLTNNRFLDIYKNVLRTDGWIKFKTDNTDLFTYTLETLKGRTDVRDLEYTFDLYHSELKPDCFDIRTHYEQKFNNQGHDIKYLKFRFS